MANKLTGVTYAGSQTQSPGIPTDGMLLAGFIPNAAFNGTTVTFQWSPDQDGGGTYIDVKETDGSAVSYTVAANKLTRVDPSGWAFASTGSIRFVSGSTEDTSSAITVLLRDA
mgnify:FL=1